MVIKKCIACGVEFKVRPYRAKTAKYHNAQCRDQNRPESWRRNVGLASKGRKHTESTKKRMSEFAKNMVRTEEHCKKISESLTGRVRSKEHAANISKAHKGNFNLEKNPNWRGGKSFEPYPLQWTEELRELVREKYNRCCALCNVKRKKPDVHHIDYNKENCAVSNLIALCVPCHRKTNHNRKHWQEVFSKIKGE